MDSFLTNLKRKGLQVVIKTKPQYHYEVWTGMKKVPTGNPLIPFSFKGGKRVFRIVPN
jgi:hypothetical protein